MSDIKKCFTSRFGPEGILVEIDWNQLEVVVLQIETQDARLQHEINTGIDLHCSMTADVYGEPYSTIVKAVKDGNPEWTKKRKEMKSARFALQYGAGAKRIAELTGWSADVATDFIKAYYRKYPKIFHWNNTVRDIVLTTAKPTGEVDKDGYPVYKGQYTSPSGRRYVFSGIRNKWNKLSFSPNQLQNYPIQGLASDFVKLMRSKLLRELYKYTYKPQCLHINTIHDSVMFDVGDRDSFAFLKDCIEIVYGKAQNAMSELVNKEREVNVPINYSIKHGSFWS